MSGLADGILHLHGWVALLVIFAIPALESSAFLGFVFPGEIAVLLGGVLAYQHKVSLAAALAAGIAGAVIGDTVGFEVGRQFGRRLLHGTIGRIVKTDHLDRAERYLAERGGKAVFLGRFTAALRVLIPGMAGMAGMPYRTFALYNVTGGTLWAGGFVLLGYIAGDSYKRFEHVAKQASLLVLLAAVVVGLAVFGARRVIRNRSRVEAFWQRWLARPGVSRLRARFRRQLDFLSRRLQPGGAVGLALTVALVALILAGWAFGTVVASVLGGGRLVGVDRPILDFFARHRTPALTDVVKVLTRLGSGAVLVPVGAVVGDIGRWRRATWRPLLLLAGAYTGSLVLYVVVKDLVARPRPPAALAVGHYPGWSFPSGHATQAAAVWGALAVVASAVTGSWSRRVVAWTVAGLIVALVGVTRVYLGAHWPSDVLGGWAAGAVWLFVVAAVDQATRRRDGPDDGRTGESSSGEESGRESLGRPRP